MRASEKTFYNTKLLHVWMTLSSLALLAVTIWMLAADHRREWKGYQRTFRDRVDPWMTRARIEQQESDEYVAREKELGTALAEARRSVPGKGLIEKFRTEVEQDATRREAERPDFSQVTRARERLAARPSEESRNVLLARLRSFVAAATLRRANAERRLRFRRAELAEARSYYEAGVGEGQPAENLERQQKRLDRIAGDVDRLAAELEDASTHLESLDEILGEITHAEDAARRALADHRATLERLHRALDQQSPTAAKDLLRMPLVDALGRPLAIEQIWLPELTIDYNFCRVARFDRCKTCHRGIDRTAPGRPFQPGLRPAETFEVLLQTPEQAPPPEPSLEDVYGLVLAGEGILDRDAATVQQILPGTAAAEAQLLAGDVIAKVNGKPIDRASVREHLLDEVEWGQPLKLQIHRGLPHPFSSHPRLDLFVGSSSPHPAAEFGCTICHDGQGSATQFKYASHTPNDPAQRKRWQKQHDWFANRHWDFPMLPERFGQSRCLKCHHDVTDLAPSRRFSDPPAAKLVAGYQLIRENGCFGCHEIAGFDDSGRPIGPDMRLEPVPGRPHPPAVDGLPPGTLRKVGPSLRNLRGKVEQGYLLDRIADPRGLLPAGRMPRFYGLHEHLQDRSLADAKRFEPVEIRAVVEYLLAVAEPVEPLPAPPGVTEEPSARRGRDAFQTHGCLACHTHEDFPDGQGTQGSDLSNIGAKFTTEAGARWLVGWIRDPARHSPRSLMPNPLLEPVPLADETTDSGEAGSGDAGAAAPKVTDPAADIAAYLLASKGDYQESQVPPAEVSDLDELALLHLAKTYPQRLAREYLDKGIPPSLADRVRGDAVELLGEMTPQKKLRYVGRRTIRKRGCFGCHDVPGFEDARPIGPALTGWGRKQQSLLAFEQVHRFVKPDRGFYHEALLAQRREGFIWQKLRAPRSFDYQKAQNKSYNERLTMGQFSFTPQQREQIITFVLGLVADPPAAKYVFQPDKQTRAIVAGRKVLDKYACAACHVIEMERWTFEFDPEFEPNDFEGPGEFRDHEFLRPRISPDRIEASMQTGARGLRRAEIVGMPQLDQDGRPLAADDDVDESDNEAFLYGFTLWEPAAINGQVWPVGGAGVLAWSSDLAAGPPSGGFDVRYFGSRLTGIRPPNGGAFAQLLYPNALAKARGMGSTVAGPETWGWVPPPLVGEGAKVRPAWLHEYLLAPYAIRPACVLRMPRYNLSAEEAGKLVDYFAAAAGVDFPYSSNPGKALDPSAATDQNASKRLDAAMRMVVDTQTHCAKCHLIGDFSPGGEIRTTLAPNLQQVQRRLRPEYIRRWLANPKTVLPYTGMPVNFPPSGEPVDPARFPGNSIEQLEAARDLLLNYDQHLSSQVSIRAMIEANAKEEQTEAGQ